MDPTSRVELPPRGADLSFLNGTGQEHDTPSRWLTFGGTPNGSTTPGTAFGSPFWASLAQTKSGGDAAGKGGSNTGGATSYSPSKEFNPFELSFFPRNTNNGDIAVGDSAPAVKLEENAEDAGSHLANPLRASLKRSHPEPSHQMLDPSQVAHPAFLAASAPPSWKRPKFDGHQDSSASSSDAAFNGSSPAVGGPSPDSGSPASSLIPTPSLQSAILPPSRKSSMPMEQVEASRLQHSSSDIHIPGVSPFPSMMAQQGHPFPTAQAQAIPQGMPTVFQPVGMPTQPQAQPYTYTGYSSQQVPNAAPRRDSQPPLAPIILPPKTAAQIQQQQRQQSPASAVPTPISAQAPPMTQINPIPYANGRAPAPQPPGATRAKSTRGKSRASGRDADDENVDDPANMSSTSSTFANKRASPTNANKKGKGASKKAAKVQLPEPEPEPEEEDENGEGPDGEVDDEKKRKAFLERNRQAACRSRQKKKEWIGNLENHAAQLQQHNSQLTSEIEELRKEMFALRHTLSFHERCGCPSINDWVSRDGPGSRFPGAQPPYPGFRPGMMPPQPMQGMYPGVPPPGTQQPHYASGNAGMPGPAASGSSASPPPEQVAAQVNRASMHIQPAPQPIIQPVVQVAPSPLPAADIKPQMPPTNINLSAASLRPQPPAISQAQQQGNSIQRPGSAGARFGLSTPNFADLFGGQMAKFPGISTPGGPSMSPAMPNTFGLAIQDIPVRPASAPPTPSPADIRVHPPSGDYFSAKNSNMSTPGIFGDLLASLNRPHMYPGMVHS